MDAEMPALVEVVTDVSVRLVVVIATLETATLEAATAEVGMYVVVVAPREVAKSRSMVAK